MFAQFEELAVKLFWFQDMDTATPRLTANQCKQARVLWDALASASTQTQMETARCKLQKAPRSVQMAIGHFIALASKQEQQAPEQSNPFA